MTDRFPASTRGAPAGLRRKLGAYAFVAPAVAYLGVFMFWPLVQQIWLSLTNAKLTNPNGGRFVGLKNYQALFVDASFWTTLQVTLVYTVASVVLGVLLGVVSALAMNRPFPGRAIVRSVLLFGWAVPNVAAALIWLWMYNDRSGVFNQIASLLGLGSFSWLTSTTLALPSVMAVTVWQVTPFVMLVVLAALQSVPEEVREAARIDGADALSTFRAVTWPHILPSVQLVSLLVAVWSIRRYDIIYLLTGGGPLHSTSTLVVQLRETAFQDYDIGAAGAYGVIGLLLALLVATLHFLIEQRRAKAAA